MENGTCRHGSNYQNWSSKKYIINVTISDIMSMNGLKYDTCAYADGLREQSTTLSYILDPVRYEHCKKCRMEFGIVGGTAVSHVAGNLVDLENDLRGANRPNTHCAAYKYLPNDGLSVQGKEYVKPVRHPVVDTTMQHLSSCQMIDYKPVPMPPPVDAFKSGR